MVILDLYISLQNLELRAQRFLSSILCAKAPYTSSQEVVVAARGTDGVFYRRTIFAQLIWSSMWLATLSVTARA